MLEQLAVNARLKYAVCVQSIAPILTVLLTAILAMGCASQALSVDDPSVLRFEHKGLNVFPRDGLGQVIEIVVYEGFDPDLDYGDPSTHEIPDPDWQDIQLGGFLFRSAFELQVTLEDTGQLTEPGKRELVFVVKNDQGFFTLIGEVTYLP